MILDDLFALVELGFGFFEETVAVFRVALDALSLGSQFARENDEFVLALVHESRHEQEGLGERDRENADARLRLRISPGMRINEEGKGARFRNSEHGILVVDVGTRWDRSAVWSKRAIAERQPLEHTSARKGD